MADASKLKSIRRQGLGAPPSPEEARDDLSLAVGPEQTPQQVVAAHQYEVASSPATEPPPRSPDAPLYASRIDGRTLRRSGRTVQFATRVSPEFDDRLRRIAMRDGLLLVEVLERALDAYEGSDKTAAR